MFLHPEASYVLIIIYLAKLKSERMIPDCQLSCLKKKKEKSNLMWQITAQNCIAFS